MIVRFRYQIGLAQEVEHEEVKYYRSEEEVAKGSVGSEEA